MVEFLEKLQIVGAEVQEWFYLVEADHSILELLREGLTLEAEWVDRDNFSVLKPMNQAIHGKILDKLAEIKEIQQILLKGYAFSNYGTPIWEKIPNTAGVHMIHTSEGIGCYYFIFCEDRKDVPRIKENINYDYC